MQRGDFSRQYRAAATDFREAADRIEAARAEIAANKARLERDTKLFWRTFWTLSGAAGLAFIAFIAWMARHQ